MQVNYEDVKDNPKCPILYGYEHYDQPRKCLYEHPTDVYDIKKGWIQKPTEAIVIGEDTTSYVTKLIRSSDGLYLNVDDSSSEYILPIGFHKSRLIKWLPTQLEILNE